MKFLNLQRWARALNAVTLLWLLAVACGLPQMNAAVVMDSISNFEVNYGTPRRTVNVTGIRYLPSSLYSLNRATLFTLPAKPNEVAGFLGAKTGKEVKSFKATFEFYIVSANARGDGDGFAFVYGSEAEVDGWYFATDRPESFEDGGSMALSAGVDFLGGDQVWARTGTSKKELNPTAKDIGEEKWVEVSLELTDGQFKITVDGRTQSVTVGTISPKSDWKFAMGARNGNEYAEVRFRNLKINELPDPKAPVPKLSLSVRSSDPTVFEVEQPAYSGGAQAAFALLPQLQAKNGGSSTITVQLSADDGTSNTTTFTATLKSGPTPSFNQIPDLVHQEGVRTNRTYTIDITGISDGDDRNPIPVTVTASSSNTALVGPDPDSGQSFPQVNYASPSPNGTVLVRISPPERGGYKGGSAESTIQVNVITEIKTVTGRFKVTAYDAPVPTLSSILDRTINEDSDTQSVYLQGIEDGDPLRNVQLNITAISDNPVLLPNPAVIHGAGNSTAELRLTPTFNQSGTATVTVTVAAAEGTYPEHYQPKAKITRTFKVTVQPVPDPVVAGSAGGVSFDGTHGQVEIRRLNALALGGEATFEFWQRAITAPTAQQFTVRLEPESDDTASANYVRTNQIRIQTPGVNGKVTWSYARSRTEVDLGGLNGLLDAWTHWAFVVSTNADALRIYRDGLLVAEQGGATGFTSPFYTVGSGTGVENRVVNYKLVLGGFTGQMSEFRLWNVARSESEIRRTKDQPLSGSEGGLMVYYRFLDGIGVAVTDHASSELQAGAQSGLLIGYAINSPILFSNWVQPSQLGLVESSLAGAYRFVRSVSEGSDKNEVVLPSFDPDLPYGEILNYEIDRTGLQGKVVGQPGSDTWLYTPNPQFSGRETIRYTVTDQAGNKASGQIELVVVARNDPPTTSLISGQTIFENGSLTVPFTVSDPDTPPTTAKITALATDRTLIRESGLTLRQSGTNWTITLTPEVGESGFTQIRLTAFDGQDASTQTFTVQVVPKPSYAVFDLGELPGKPSTTAAAINERGQVVGWATGDTSDSGSRGFFFNGIENGGKMFQLPTLDLSGGGFSRALGINYDGDVTGVASYSDGRFRAFKWNLQDGLSAEAMNDLGSVPGGQNSIGYAINSAGDVAGASTTSGATTPSAMYRPGLSLGASGSARIANTFGAPYTGTNIAVGINDRGVVVGTVYDTSNRGTNSMRRAFIFDTVNDAAPRPLGALASLPESVHTNTTAAAINNSSVVAGTYARLKAPFGQVLTLDGSRGQLMSSGGPLTLNNTNRTFTIEFWFKRNGSRSDEVILSQGAELQIGFDVSNRFYALCGGSRFEGPVVADMVWHHAAVVFDGLAGDRQLFLDGVMVTRDAVTGRHESTGSTTLGAGDGNRFHGELDEVRFWSVPRTAVQIRNGQYGWTGGIEGGLLARWSFDNTSLDDGNQIRGVSAIYTNDLTQPTGTAPANRGTTTPYRLSMETTRLTGSGVSPANVSVVGSRVYVPEGTAGLEIFESSTSGGLRRLGGFNTAGNAAAATAVGNRVLVADGSNGLVTLDVTDAATPVLLSTYQTTNGAISAVRVSGNIAVVTANRTVELLDVREVITARYSTNLVEITRANNLAVTLTVPTSASAVLDNDVASTMELPFFPARESGLLLAVTNQLAVDFLRVVAPAPSADTAAIRGFRLLGGKSTNATEFAVLAEGEFPVPNGVDPATVVIRASSAYPAYKFVVTSLHSETATRFAIAELDFLRETLTPQSGGTVSRLASIPLSDAELALGRTPDIEISGTTGYIVGGRGVVQTVSLDPQRAALSLVSDAVPLNVVTPPSITAQPTGWTNSAGGSASFRVRASGDFLNYQWRRDGNPLIGANGPVLIVNPITQADAGRYTVSVSNSSGSVVSSEAVLTIAAPAAQIALEAESTETLGQAVDAARSRFVATTPLPTGSGWAETTSMSFDSGSRSLTAGGKTGGQSVIDDGGRASMTLNVTGPGIIRFAWKVSSEPRWDVLMVAVDNVSQDSISGEIDWQEKSVSIGAGAHTVTWTYSKDASVAGGSDQAWVDAIDVLQGAAVVGQTAWRSGGSASWTSQTSVTKDGVDAAASGAIDHSQESWMETIVEGPGTLSFHWRVSSESSFDYLRLSVDGAEQDKISGVVDWTQKSLEIQPGRHTVRWAYTKDGSAIGGSDKAWVDQVQFVSGLSLNFAQQPAGNNIRQGGSVTLSASVGSGSSYTLVSGLRTWSQAKQHAEAAGGRLASITSDSKWRDILAQVPLSELFEARAWIGLSDEATEGSYRWVNGDTYSYSRWNAGEPNNSSAGGSGGEDYVQIATDTGLWNDLSGSEKATGYLLEKPFVVTYQWQKDGVNVSGATNTSLTLTNFQLADAGGYRLLAQDSRGRILSQTAAVNFTPPASTVASVTTTSGLEVRVFNDNRFVDTSGGINGEYTNVWSTLQSLGFRPVGFFGTNFGSARVVVIPSFELGTPSLSAGEQAAWSNYVARGNSVIAMNGNTAKWLNTWLGTRLEVRETTSQAGPITRGAEAVGTAFEDDAATLADLRVTDGLHLSTFAGSGTAAFTNGVGMAAAFNTPEGIALDASKNLYVAEFRNNRIRKITPDGTVTTFAGSGTEGFADGSGTSAQFRSPAGVAVDSSGIVYVSDHHNSRIRKITSAGVVSTLAGSGVAGSVNGTGTAAQFHGPVGLALDSSGNLYVADSLANQIRRVTPSGVVTTFAGTGTAGYLDGPGTSAQFNGPQSVVVDSSGNVYVGEYLNNRIRKITTTGAVSTLAGSGIQGNADGDASTAQFNWPVGMALESSGSLLVADTAGSRIRRVSASGVVTTLAGDRFAFADGVGSSGLLAGPKGIAVDASGIIYVADSGNHRIRKLSRPVNTIAGTASAGFADGTGTSAQFRTPSGVAVATNGTVYVADSENHRIRRITVSGEVSTFAGSGVAGFADGTGTAAQFNSPRYLALDAAGNLYVSDETNHRIRKITPAGAVTTWAGAGTAAFADGTGTAAQFRFPRGIGVDSNGNVFVADAGNSRIRKITPGGVVTTVAGGGASSLADGTGAQAGFHLLEGLVVDSDSSIYITDYMRVRKVSSAGVVTTVAGSGAAGSRDGFGSAAEFYYPKGLALDGNGGLLVVDSSTHLIRRVTFDGAVTTISGSTSSGHVDGLLSAARFSRPQGIAFDSSRKRFYITDDHKVRQLEVGFSASGLAASTLPSGARKLYLRGEDAVVASFPVGLGRVTYIGSDWSNTRPLGALDGGWVEVLNSAVVESARPASEPRLYLAGIRNPASLVPGTTATLQANAAGAGSVSYQWLKDGLAILGETNGTYSATAQAGATNRYSVRATASGGPGVGGQLKLGNPILGLTIHENRTYLALGSAGVEIWDLRNIAFPQKLGSFDTPSEARDIGVTKVGNVVFAYVTDGVGGVQVWDVTAPSNAKPVISRDDGTASWVAILGDQALVTDPSGLQSYQIRTVPTIQSHPVTVTRNWGQSVEFRVSAEGTPPLRYQWKRNGINIPEGTGAVLTLTDITPDVAGWYQVEVSNNFTTSDADKALSISAGLTVRSIPRLEMAAAGVSRKTVPTTPIRRAFVYQDGGGSGELEDIGSLEPNVDSEALGLNDLGQVVGYSFRGADKRATLTVSGEVFDLNETLPEENGWKLVEARGINSRGEIVGVGQFNGRSRAFLLVPAATIGRKVVRPLGAVAAVQPSPEILSGNPQNDPANTFYHWSDATGKLYAVRPGVSKLSWSLSANPADTNRIYSVVANVWPRQITKHIAGAPVEIEPRGVGFLYNFQQMHYPVGEAGVSLDTSAKLFNASVFAPPVGAGTTNEVLKNQAYTVLRYLRTDGDDPNPRLQAPYFEIVRTFQHTDPRVRVADVPWDVATTITYTNHTDYPGRNGYVLFEKAFYDGAGPDRAYDRPTRTGPIIPVNALSGGKVSVDPLLVVWYQMNGIGVAWPGEPRQYALRWPVGGKKIVIASLQGSGDLPSSRYAEKRVYLQPDQSLPGFNLNEEHAIIADGKVFALRNDLNGEKLSEPFALLKYRNPQTQQWGMEAYKVVAEEAPFFFKYTGEAGKEIQPPLPLSVLPICPETLSIDGPGWEDYKGKLYARAAGPLGTDTNIVVRYHYPIQAGFYLPLKAGETPLPEGTCIPWLDGYARTPGTPVNITYRIVWPNAPTLEIGSTLTRPRVGLPDLFSMAKVQIIHDDLDPELTGRDGLAKLFDPLSPRTLKLAKTEIIPDLIRRVNINGVESFPDLPYVIRLRVSYDPINRWLSFSGHLDEAFGVGEPLLLPNVMSDRERDRIKLLAEGNRDWSGIVDRLYDLSRNPNQVDLDPADGVPDKGLRLGMKHDAQGRVVPEEFGALPKALTAGLGGVAPAQPRPGNALRFDGENDYVSLGNVELLRRSFTVEFWAKREGTSSGFARAVAAQGVGGGSGSLFIGFDGGDRFVFSFGGPADEFRLLTPTSYADQDWHHWACTYDAGSGVQRILRDGQSVAVVTNLARPYLGVGALTIGAALGAGNRPADWYSGTLDELRIWDGVAKNAASLQHLSQKRLLGSEDGLRAYYRFDNPSQPGSNDALVANPAFNNGQVFGAVSIISDAPVGIPPRFLTLVENNDPALPGLPVGLKVIRVDDGPFRGDLKVLPSDNIFDERLTLRHSSDFGGDPTRVRFEWYYHPADDGGIPPALPGTDATGQITDLKGWVRYNAEPPSGEGVNDITLGEGKESSLITLSDNYFICRFRGYAVGTRSADTWSDWVGDPTSTDITRPQLAEGWIKRVLRGLNPFDARTADFRSSEVNTFASMLVQAGTRYEGDIAFNPSADNVNRIGLIEAYETVLRRGRNLSIDGIPAVNFSPANNALLLAATKIADLYVLLGNEAYADAQDPTIGFSTGGATSDAGQGSVYGSLASSIFTFQNQLDSLLEEELVLLRGRDDTAAGVGGRPVYNKLFWNFTLGDGEVAYQQNYNISDQNNDGFIDEKDARILYPQGHGDAWGHYLTAIKAQYQLLQHTNFTWIPRTEAVLVAGAAVEVDFQDERKFARTAAQKAKTGSQIVDLTYRLNFVDDASGQWQGYTDRTKDRAWGVTEWARRSAQGAYFDWVTGNAILPSEDTDPTHQGIRKVDRTTVTELSEIAVQRDDIQTRMDQADTGLNPLGLAKGAVSFDLDPSEVAAGKTHFEQVAERAEKSLRNAVLVWDEVNKASELLRRNQDSVERFQSNVRDQERDYKNRLIEAFGYPYAGDIGPGKTYPTGYDGPDLYHYMYVPTTDLNGQNSPPGVAIKAFYKEIRGMEQKLNPAPQELLKKALGVFFPSDLPESTQDSDVTSLEGEHLVVNYPRVQGDYAFTAPSEWGQRRAPGEIQLALSDMVQAQARLKQMINQYDALVDEIEGVIGDGEMFMDGVKFAEKRVDLIKKNQEKQSSLSEEVTKLRQVSAGLAKAGELAKEYGEATAEALPKSTGVSSDVTAPARSTIQTLALVAGHALTIGSLAADHEAGLLEDEKEAAANQSEIDLANIDVDQARSDAKFEAELGLRKTKKLLSEEAPMRLEVYNQKEVLSQAVGRYQAAVAKGLRLVEERVNFRKTSSAATSQSRYQDMTFRIFRNDALQKYRAQFDLAARYVFMAATAYDYEVNLLGSDTRGGQAFLTDIIRQRSLGQVANGVPQTGRPGLADPMARLSQNFEVLKTQMGFNNPQTETSRFSIRKELFRIGDGSSLSWRNELMRNRINNLWDLPEFRRFCRPFAAESSGPQPGIVIRFPTTVTSRLNFFGWPLGGGDSSYDASRFATKVRSLGVWFNDYDGNGLAFTPRVYLVPVGMDVLRPPSGNDLSTREWRVVDQALPVPFQLGASVIRQADYLPNLSSLGGSFAEVRRFASFRAYHDAGFFDPSQVTSDSRLIGRSVWNTEWLLIIPGATFLSDADAGLDLFINTIQDIKLYFQTYSYSGN